MTAQAAVAEPIPGNRSPKFLPNTHLYARSHGGLYEAMTFEEDGKIKVEVTAAPSDDQKVRGVYDSPSAAGKAITGSATNGYVFWKTEPVAERAAAQPKALVAAKAKVTPIRAKAPAAKKAAPAKKAKAASKKPVKMAARAPRKAKATA